MIVARPEHLYRLDSSTVALHLDDFLGSDVGNESYNLSILTRPTFKPDTFYVSERLSDPSFLAPGDRDWNEWVHRFIDRELDLLEKQRIVSVEDRLFVVEYCSQQLSLLLDHTLGEMLLAENLTNQELPDVVRKVIAYCLTGNPNGELYSSESFNGFARRVIPYLLEKYSFQKRSARDLVAYSIASGLIGLDIKGAYSAASAHSRVGIELSPIITLDRDHAVDSIYLELEEVVQEGLVVDYWDAFTEEILDQDCTLVWFPDDYIETLFDLLLIQRLLTANKSLRIILIPRNGRYGNDASCDDVCEFLTIPLFETLSLHLRSGRLRVSSKGPRMGAISLRKLSKEVVDAIMGSKAVFVKGCRAHEMIQGGLNAVVYAGYVVAREFTERETGLDARKSPLVLIRSNPGEYCHWGFKGCIGRTKVFSDGRRIPICCSTLEEHECRKTTMDVPGLVEDLKYLIGQHGRLSVEYTIPYKEEIRLVVDRLGALTKATYETIASKYEDLRCQYPGELEIELFENLLKLARSRVREELLGDSKGVLSLLDVGTGHGRDLRYFCSVKDLRPVGIDNAKSFLGILERFAESGDIPKDSFVEMDMRHLDGFEDASFDMVRNNATLLHLPLTPVGIGADEAIAETFRVLKPFGLFFVFVKAGQGLQYLDTGEGLGGRIFQLYTRESLCNLLRRHGFRIVDVVERHTERPSGGIDWIGAYAERPGI